MTGGIKRGVTNPWLLEEPEETRGLGFHDIRQQQRRIIEGKRVLLYVMSITKTLWEPLLENPCNNWHWSSIIWSCQTWYFQVAVSCVSRSRIVLVVFLTGNIFSKQLFKTISIWIEVSNLCCDRGAHKPLKQLIVFLSTWTCKVSLQSDASNSMIIFCLHFSEVERVIPEYSLI